MTTRVLFIPLITWAAAINDSRLEFDVTITVVPVTRSEHPIMAPMPPLNKFTYWGP